MYKCVHLDVVMVFPQLYEPLDMCVQYFFSLYAQAMPDLFATLTQKTATTNPKLSAHNCKKFHASFPSTKVRLQVHTWTKQCEKSWKLESNKWSQRGPFS